MGYLAAAFATDIFGGANMTRVISGIQCKGNSNIQNLKYHHLNPIFRISNNYFYLSMHVRNSIYLNMTRDISGNQCKGNSNIENLRYHHLNPFFRVFNNYFYLSVRVRIFSKTVKYLKYL